VQKVKKGKGHTERVDSVEDMTDELIDLKGTLNLNAVKRSWITSLL